MGLLHEDLISNIPWRKALLMSSWCKCHPFVTTMVRITRMVVNCTIGQLCHESLHWNIDWNLWQLIVPCLGKWSIKIFLLEIYIYIQWCFVWVEVEQESKWSFLKAHQILRSWLNANEEYFWLMRMILVQRYRVFVRRWHDRCRNHPCFWA